ncbi:MAG: hypothetical protein IKA55_01320, partial [Akkermansia sp.]|nr:hypothetical protein [Akkermansia sp.]
LERAFARSAGAGMLDLLRHGLPLGAGPFPAWLRERAQELLMQHLRRLRRGDDAAPQLSAQQAAAWLEGMPPVYGGSVTAGMLCEWFASLGPALAWQAERELTTPEKWLESLGEGWQQLGTLCFHLAENGGEGAETHPFAFLATFIHRAGQDGKPRHAPLALARQLYAGDAGTLATLLRPLQQAAAEHPFLNQLINSGEVYKPCAWGPRQAYDFLESLPVLEQAGIETRMVNLWQSRPPRVELEVQLHPGSESQKPDRAPALNISTLLRFSPRVVLGNYALTEAELEELLAGEDGLIRFRGEWVRLDREKLEKLLNSWRQATRMAAGGIPLLAGLRWLLGKHSSALPNIPPPDEDGMRAIAAPVLQEALQQLCLSPQEPQLPAALAATLRPYQKDGVRFLLGVTEAGFGACLADDMGLGKTLQVIAWLAHLHATGALAERAALIVAPASLLTNWQDELRKFAPQLNTLVLHPDMLNRQDTDYLQKNPAWLLRRAHVALTTYGMATRLAELLAAEPLPALVLDEAQAIKNADSQRTRALLQLSSPRRVALTGTPVENSLGELRSLFHFLTPGLLGSEKEFNALVQKMGTDYTPLRKLVRPFMLRRLKTDPGLLPELPPKTEQPAYCLLTPEQTRLYAREVEKLQAIVHEPDPQTRLTLLLPILSHLKQICNHPAQYLGESYYDPARSGKMSRLGHLARQIAAAGDAALIFTQYRSMMEPLHDFLAGIFGAPGLVLHGGTPIAERRKLVQQFQHPGGPPFFLLSLKAAGTGLTLTRARHVIHFDRWWNPAVENQASDRAYRIGQQNPVIIHPLICRGTIEENIHTMLTRKRDMADKLLAGGLEKLLLHLTPRELCELIGGGGNA